MNATTVRVVALREITTRLRDRTFLISTAFLLLVVGLSLGVPLFLNRDDGPPKYTLVTVGATAQTAGELAQAAGQQAVAVQNQRDESQDTTDVSSKLPSLGLAEAGTPAVELTLKQAPDLDAAEAQVRSGDADAAVMHDERGFSVVGDDGVDADLSQLLTQATTSSQLLDRLAQVGVGQAQAAELLRAEPPAQRLLDPPTANAGLAIALGIGFAVLFYFTSFMFGFAIAQSVVEEKQSRVVEILVAAVPVRELLYGKVLGNVALALGQIALLVAVGFAAVSAGGQPELVTAVLGTGGWFLLFFVLGFSMLACLWAVAGALAGRVEDLQGTTLPLQVLTMGPFFAAVYVTSPGAWMTALSWFPLSAPLVMPRRLLIGDATWLEAAGAALVVLATGMLLLSVATRLYEGALMRTSGKTSWRTAWTGNEKRVTTANPVRE